MKYTKEPWKWEPKFNWISSENSHVIIAENILLTHPKGWVVTEDEERQGNGTLIEAAPAMYEALQQIILDVDHPNEYASDHALLSTIRIRAKKALAQVERTL
jgi:hypothetical protein